MWVHSLDQHLRLFHVIRVRSMSRQRPLGSASGDCPAFSVHLRGPSSASSASSKSSHLLSLSWDTSGGKDCEKVLQEQNCGKGMVPESASKHSPQGSWSASEGLIVRYTSSLEVGEGVPGGWCMSRSSLSLYSSGLPSLLISQTESQFCLKSFSKEVANVDASISW